MARTPKQSKEQKQTVARVMHEFKQDELEIGGGRKVKDPKQAIAIALHEAGASNEVSPQENRRNLRKTKARERKGETAKARQEGESSRTASPRERLGSRVSKAGRATARARTRAEKTRAELYAEAKRRNIPGRSRMSKSELERALR